MAIIITIMVLELKVPHEDSLEALRPVLPVFLSYVLSFVNVGIYWNNHHHMLAVTERVNGAVLWANIHLLFWLSLIPFTAAWMGENHFAAVPTAVYGMVLLGASAGYVILHLALLKVPGQNPALAQALGADFKGKLSFGLYVIAVVVAFVLPWIAQAIYVLVALMWLVPDQRIERLVDGSVPMKLEK